MKTFTGERYMPFVTGQIELEHYHRYEIANSLVENKTILDIASGEGYGSATLSKKAKFVYGVDIDLDSIDNAKKTYSHIKNIEFIHGSCSKVPINANSVDLVCSFETIEHHNAHEEMMSEILRVMKPDGTLIISSPDKYFYSDQPKYKNPFHVKELYHEEFQILLNSHFKNTLFFDQKVCAGSLIVANDKSQKQFKNIFKNNNQIDAINGLKSPIYNIAIASNGPLPNLFNSFFETKEINGGLIEKYKVVKSELDHCKERLEMYNKKGILAKLAKSIFKRL
jgi:ubiquinone/menaquinone biosynthesis C-methylase UbiE